MLDVVLVAPEIATNTGNIIRLCANTGARLHLVEPLGFVLTEPAVRRAGLDYHELTDVCVHADLTSCLDDIGVSPDRVFALSGRGEQRYDTVAYRPGDVVVFGCEGRGLDEETLAATPEAQRLRIPMQPGNRSLNLANAVAVVVYEAWRQAGFTGGTAGGTVAESTSSAPFVVGGSGPAPS